MICRFCLGVEDVGGEAADACRSSSRRAVDNARDPKPKTLNLRPAVAAQQCESLRGIYSRESQHYLSLIRFPTLWGLGFRVLR